ncbi:MAG TPA: hypothetical protein VGO00_15790 [Kofleriaceae bacterium]|nr:hypothetical protein [Kofleriaceae bacterium]
MRSALLVAALASCSLNRTVLEGAVIDCAQALHGGANGDPCSLDETCSDALDCCTTTAYCRDGSLVVDKVCNPDCAACNDDSACTFGAAICTNHRCVPCDGGCPVDTCPVNWPHLTRNGCRQCACAPAATCSLADQPCATGMCYRGAVCAPGCTTTDAACCADQCEQPGCPSPVPTGCLMPCPPPLGSCTTCAADACVCMGGQWSCTAICADGLNTSCLAPPAMMPSPP